MIETAEVIRNGVNVSKLGQMISVIRHHPELARFTFRARNRWNTGARSLATVDGFYGTSRELRHDNPLTIQSDEPAALLGEDTGMNPVEIAMASLSACMTTTLAYKAAGMGLEFESIESEFEGDIDARGLTGVSSDTRTGYQEIRVKFYVKGDGDPKTIEELIKHSPVYDSLTNPVTIRIEVAKV